MDSPAKTVLGERASRLRRWNEKKPEPPRMSQETRMQREFLGDLVGSPAWERILTLKNGVIEAYKVPIPTKIAQEKPYQTYCVVRDILDEFIRLVELDVSLSSVTQEE